MNTGMDQVMELDPVPGSREIMKGLEGGRATGAPAKFHFLGGEKSGRGRLITKQVC